MLAALAAGIVATDRSETIRGTAGADRISGRGGNDVLIGYGGRDVVDGGRAPTVYRSGMVSVTRRSAGQAGTSCCDAADVVLGDCEDLRVVPPEPTAPRLADGPATYKIVVSGLLTVGIATGSVQLGVQLPAYACKASDLRWTAAAATLTGP